MRKALRVKGGEIILRMREDATHEFSKASALVVQALDGIEARPVIPREIEDTLGISTTERRKWLADVRLPSAGSRTVKLRGRAKITFHVFDPVVVEDILDRAAVDSWRADDAERAAQNRRYAASKAKLRTTKSIAENPQSHGQEDEQRFMLRGWAEFERDGF